MISEGSCDTEDWSNDAENSDLIAGINYILKYTNIVYFSQTFLNCDSQFFSHSFPALTESDQNRNSE